MRRLKFRPSLAESKRNTQKAMDYYRALSPNETERFDAGATEKRTRGPVNHAESEALVLDAVGKLLAYHPRVAIAIRMNSGMAQAESGAPVWFHKLVRGYGVLTDYIGVLTNGKPFAIECKRPDWKGVSLGSGATSLREQAQQDYINGVRSVGGVGGFARGVEEAQAIVEGG